MGRGWLAGWLVDSLIDDDAANGNRALYPEAQFIELEPASKDTTSFAIDGHREKMLRELEHVTLNQLLIAIAKNVVKHNGKKKDGGEGDGGSEDGQPR